MALPERAQIERKLSVMLDGQQENRMLGQCVQNQIVPSNVLAQLRAATEHCLDTLQFCLRLDGLRLSSKKVSAEKRETFEVWNDFVEQRSEETIELVRRFCVR